MLELASWRKRGNYCVQQMPFENEISLLKICLEKCMELEFQLLDIATKLKDQVHFFEF